MSKDRVARSCYAFVIGGLCAHAFSLLVAFAVGFVIITTVCAIAEIFGK